MAQLLLSILDVKEGIEEIQFSLSDIQDWLAKKGFRGYDSGSIRNVLQNTWNLRPESNQLLIYNTGLVLMETFYDFNIKGRFYRINQKKIFHLNNLDDFDAILITSS